MKKKTRVLAIVFSCIAALLIIGAGVFLYLKLSKQNITPPSDNLAPADREIAQKFDLSAVYNSQFKQIGWKVSRAADSSTSGGKLVIPSTYRGLPILEIGNAFNGWTEIEQVVLPSTLTNIGTDNEKGSFKNCTNLAKIQFNNESSIKAVGQNAFYGCNVLSSIDLSACELIDNSAFENCSLLTNVQVGNKLEKIGDYAFAYSKITEFVIPSSTSQIGANPFAYGRLTSILVDSQNTDYSSSNNCVIEIQSNKLVIGSKNSTIPQGTEIIGKNAFAGCNKSNITLPSSVTIIEQSAFNSFLGTIQLNEGLQIIESQAFVDSGITINDLPATVTTLGTEVFAGCLGLGEDFNASGVYKIGIAVFANTPVLYLTLYGGSNFEAETDGSYDFTTNSLIESVTYLYPIA